MRISRPGIDVTNPPSLTEAHLVMDWSWPRVERLMASGIVRGSSIAPGANYFDFPFASVGIDPFAAVVPIQQGTTTHLDEQIYLDYTQFWNVGGVIGTFYSYATAFRWVTYPHLVRVLAIKSTGAATGFPLWNYDWAIMVFRPF